MIKINHNKKANNSVNIKLKKIIYLIFTLLPHLLIITFFRLLIIKDVRIKKKNKVGRARERNIKNGFIKNIKTININILDIAEINAIKSTCIQSTLFFLTVFKFLTSFSIPGSRILIYVFIKIQLIFINIINLTPSRLNAL